MSETTPETTSDVQQPLSLSDILADLQGFGIEDLEDYISISSGSRTVKIKFSNIPSEEERLALLAVEEFKGYTWIQEVKAEILSRAISWLNGVHIHKLSPIERRVVDPKTGEERDIQVVLRNLIKGWGNEYLQVLWKILMVHSQNIEDRLLESFPDAATTTEAERRYTERAAKEIEDQMRPVIEEQVTRLFEETEEATS